MRKLILQMMISVDGYFEGPNHELDWHNVDDEFNELAISFLDTVDTLLFGRETYELMAGYWPTEHATTDDPIVAAKMNSLRKVVVSRTLKSVAWNNSALVKGNVVDEVRKLKQLPGKNVAIFGSSDLAAALTEQQLIDEYRIMVNPVILGAGKSLFDGLGRRQQLKLVESKVFRSGNVLLRYQPERAK
jgi:dihydrofolate reductase